MARVKALLAGCRFAVIADADAGRASEWLIALRRDAAPVAVPSEDSFTPAATAKLLGISGAAVRAAVTRWNLPATGIGKARTFPRATVEALVLNRAKGCGPETANHYVRAVRGFFRWLVKAKRFGSNPLDSLSLVNSAVDVRHARRELTADELRRLFVASRTSHRSFRGLAGPDRYMLYLVAAGTGFRSRAMANLTPADFDIEAGTVTLPARFNKSGKTKVQPLPSDVAAALGEYLNGKPAGELVWGGTWATGKRGAAMIRRDLEAAGIPYATEGPDGPEYADFHALRHSFLTLGGRSGIDLRTLQELAGHSKPELTARYSHRRLYDLARAVDKLPALVPTETVALPHEVTIPLRMTGTDGVQFATTGAPGVASGGVSGVVPGVVAGDIRGHFAAPSGTLRIVGGREDDSSQPLEMTRPGATQHRAASVRTQRGRRDSNPQPPDRQSGALTN